MARALERERVLAAMVVDEWRRYVGLVDRPDAEAAPAHECLHGLVRVVAPVREGTALAAAIARMVQERARALPVVDEDRRPVGLLSELDAQRWVRQSRGSLRIPAD
ncbi:MAG TPA: CBS domain-containing protein [Polyangiaceae bacterium]|nr:CBS domain-containing protein [Polyangiaceae bacterium]